LARVHELDRNEYLDAVDRLKKAGTDAVALKRDVAARVKENRKRAAEEDLNVDIVARHAVESGKGVGWWVNTKGAWISYRFHEAKAILQARELPVDGVIRRA